ncbi:MAG: hypothetical protein M1823_004115 [Watsoniomyces obsoletus]|nr:MAG: hypothetical protein M1823_004115 [Watsoniomyces obsoletus]
MARLARPLSPDADQPASGHHPPSSSSSSSSTHPRGIEARHAQQQQQQSPVYPPSPEVGYSSDKENRTSAHAARQRQAKEKSTPTGPGLQTPQSHLGVTPRGSKRRRLVDEQARMPPPSQVANESMVDEDTQFYDPDQDIEERRAVRKGFRDLTRQLNGSRTEYMAPGDRGLMNTLQEANRYFAAVKQTSDATLDSRLLVSAADISYKKTAQMTLGDAAQGIDVDEFVSKCITFMRLGPGDGSGDRSSTSASGSASQSQRRQRRHRPTVADNEVSDDGDHANVDEGDALNWEILGRKACFPHNARPAVPGFLLGPLSVQKRVRAQRSQRPRQPRRDPADVVRAQELQAVDIEKVENSNLTVLCTRIRSRLVQVQKEGQEAVEAEASKNADDSNNNNDEHEMSQSEIKTLMNRHGICDDGGVGFFNFIVNPRSFGQTVENLFYVSFLIRDGSVGIGEDSDHLPTLHATHPRKISEIKEQGIHKHQAVFHLDWHTWEELIKTFNLRDPVIPHRNESDEVLGRSGGGSSVGAGRWYG